MVMTLCRKISYVSLEKNPCLKLGVVHKLHNANLSSNLSYFSFFEEIFAPNFQLGILKVNKLLVWGQIKKEGNKDPTSIVRNPLG
jgi:hypothetical protein